MYQALYRKYRPTSFDEVVGQKIIVKTLINAIENNRISHAYIFSGPRGTGKTSIAKIFAKTINCEHPIHNVPCNKCTNCIDYNNKKTVDIIEIDAASNNGVDEIRNLKSSVNLVPNNSKYKVYIIDEVHMLSTSAFNALLKTLEEPPKYVIFILATTELYKVPDTIVSRCQNFDFCRITVSNIVDRLSYICKCENIKYEEDALKLVASYSNGGMRDAIGLLDQLSSYKNETITINDVEDICGLVSSEQIYALISRLLNNDLKDVINSIVKYNNDGKNLLFIFEKIVNTFKDILIYNNASDYFTDKNIKDKLKTYSSSIKEYIIYDLIDVLKDTIKNMKYENNKLLLAELCLIKINNLLNNDKYNVKKEINNQAIIRDDTTLNIISQEIKPSSLSRKNEIVNLSNFKEFKSVRINNALATFNRKDLLDFKEKILMIKDYVSSEKYGAVVSLLLDGELKAKGNNYIIYVYNDSKMSNFFNNKLKEIETFMLEIFKQEFKVISATLNEWEIIKKDFNNSLKKHEKKYSLKKDVELVVASEKKTIEANAIDNMFSEIVKYE